MPLDAGKLRTPITIQRKVAAANAWGDPSTTWETYCTTRADVRAPSGLSVAAEGVRGERELSAVAYSMRIRWRVGVTNEMRVSASIQGTPMLFEIKSVAPDVAKREYVDLVCVAGVSA